MQPELPCHGAELFLGGLVERDPSHPASLANSLLRLLPRPRLLGPASVHADDVVHDHTLVREPFGPQGHWKENGCGPTICLPRSRLHGVREQPLAEAVVATDSVSVDADYDNGAALHNMPRSWRSDHGDVWQRKVGPRVGGGRIGVLDSHSSYS